MAKTAMTKSTTPQRVPVPHPGEILRIEFLEPLGLTQYRLAQKLDITNSQVSKLVRGDTGVTAAMALKLAKCFGNRAEFWLGLQQDFDLWHAHQTIDLSRVEALDPQRA